MGAVSWPFRAMPHVGGSGHTWLQKACTSQAAAGSGEGRYTIAKHTNSLSRRLSAAGNLAGCGGCRSREVVQLPCPEERRHPKQLPATCRCPPCIPLAGTPDPSGREGRRVSCLDTVKHAECATDTVLAHCDGPQNTNSRAASSPPLISCPHSSAAPTQRPPSSPATQHAPPAAPGPCWGP
jgi:hypothetical protein